MRFILASQSPSRKKILSDLGYSFLCIPADIDESFDYEKSIHDNAIALAKEKSEKIFLENPTEIVVGSDSIMLDPNGKLLEKPRDKANAVEMMENRSGKTEILVSGLAIFTPHGNFFGSEETKISWKKFSPEEIEKIIETGEWEGKCGGVMIEGFTGLFVSKIEGSVQNVMGFPLNSFWKGTRELKILDL